ncbi:MAG: response regulator [Brevundimonas sp.]
MSLSAGEAEAVAMEAPCGLALLGPDYRVRWINAYLANLLGVTAGPCDYRLQDFVTPASRIFLQTRLQQELAAGGRVEEMALDLLGDAGRRVPVMMSAVQDASDTGAPVIRLAMSRAPVRRAYEAEVPKARLAAEAEREAARAIIAGFVRNSPVPLVMTDAALTITNVSHAWEAAYGRSAEQAVGERIDQRDSEGGVADPFWTRIYARALAGESLSGDAPARSSRLDAWFEWAVIPWRDATGAIGGLLLMNFDVTALIRARDAAASADEMKSRFLANMSHELRTPLNSVLAPIELLKGRDLAPDVRAQLDGVGRAGKALTQVLTTILDFSQLETGAFEVNSGPVDLDDLCQGVLAHCADDLGERPIRLIGPGDVGARAVLGDADALHRILSQLLSNAAKFTESGTIALEVGFATETLTFTVSDTGCGFDDREFATLMQPFHQRDLSSTRRHGGVGLGLALASALAGALGGRLDAVSTPGEGSRVSLTVPLRWGDAIERLERPPEPAEDRPLRVLAVDDNPANLAVLAAILRVVEADVDLAVNGAEAVERAAEREFDVILMDVQMPVMDGLSAIRAIRAAETPAGRRTPIVVVSANVSRPEIAAAMAAGADHVLGKPVGAGALIETLAKALEPRAAAA